MDKGRRQQVRRSERLQASSEVQSPTQTPAEPRRSGRTVGHTDRHGRSERPECCRSASWSPGRRSRSRSWSPLSGSPRGGSHHCRSPSPRWSPRAHSSGSHASSWGTSTPQGRVRGIRFSEQENLILCEEVVQQFPELYGHLSGKTDVRTKERLWATIRAAIRDVEGVDRTAQTCRKRFTDIKLKLHKKLTKLRHYATGSGGGPPASLKLTPYEEVVEPFIQTEALHGIPGGYDADLPSLPSSEADEGTSRGTQPNFHPTEDIAESAEGASAAAATAVAVVPGSSVANIQGPDDIPGSFEGASAAVEIDGEGPCLEEMCNLEEEEFEAGHLDLHISSDSNDTQDLASPTSVEEDSLQRTEMDVRSRTSNTPPSQSRQDVHTARWHSRQFLQKTIGGS
ncbi:uncharacterized protein [Hyperolius riggenbachi]|uniref:uncharacterized protein n=1 Tax=Hyperolius riggenbachi TaxID=752182 RepID=UPI0035A2CCAC